MHGERARGAGGKTMVFGLFKRNSGFTPKSFLTTKKLTLQRVIRGKVNLDSVSIPMVGVDITDVQTWVMPSIA